MIDIPLHSGVAPPRAPVNIAAKNDQERDLASHVTSVDCLLRDDTMSSLATKWRLASGPGWCGGRSVSLRLVCITASVYLNEGTECMRKQDIHTLTRIAKDRRMHKHKHACGVNIKWNKISELTSFVKFQG